MRIQWIALLVLTLEFSLCSLTARGQLTTCSIRDQPISYLTYNPSMGSMRLIHAEGADAITTFELVASEDFFIGPKPPEFNGLFDVWNPRKAFRLFPSGFTSFDWPDGTVATGVSNVAELLTLSGSFLRGGALQVEYCNFAPTMPTVVLAGPNWQTDDIPTFVYDSAIGTLELDNPRAEDPGAAAIAALELVSLVDLFTGSKPDFFSGARDVWTPRTMLIAQSTGFHEFEFSEPGSVETGIEHLHELLTLSGSYTDANSLGQFDLITVPEPTGGLLMMPVICFLRLRRR